MAYTTAITTTKANVEALITALTGSETIDELLIIDKAATGLDCSNYGALETAIETLIDTQTSSTEHEDIMLASVMLGATQARTHTRYETVVVTSSGDVAVPIGAEICYVSGGAAGGDGNTYSYGGGGGGAGVIEFPIGVQGGATINVINGNQQTIGNLVLGAGGGGGAGGVSGGGGAAGKVYLAGAEQSNSATVINGGTGGDAGLNGEDAGGFIGGSGTASYGGGGASYGGNGGNGDQALSAIGVIYGSGGGGSVSGGRTGSGTFTDITLKFKIVEVVE